MIIIKPINFRSLLALNLEPTTISDPSTTLTDNVFSNIIYQEVISASLTATSSNHLPQYSIFSNIFGNTNSNKSIIMKETVEKLNKIFFS